MKKLFLLLLLLMSVLAEQAHSLPVTADQQIFADQLASGNFSYAVLETGPRAGKLAVFEDNAVAFASNDGFWRQLLKVLLGIADVAAPLLEPYIGPVGVGAVKVVVSKFQQKLLDKNKAEEAEKERKKIKVIDTRLYETVQVDGLGDILPGVIAAALANTVTSIALTPAMTLSFIDPAVIAVRAKDSTGLPIESIDLAQAFILTTDFGAGASSLFGSFVVNTVGFQGSRPLNETDYIDVDVGPLLTVPDGTRVTVRSTMLVGSTQIPEPPMIALMGMAILAAWAAVRRTRRPALSILHRPGLHLLA